MPGFNVTGSEAKSDGNKLSKIESRRKHRWKYTLPTPIGRASVYLMSAQRPHAIVEIAEMHHDEEQAGFAGKYKWEPIALVFYDVKGGETDICKLIYDWFKKTIDIPAVTVATPGDYKQTSKLEMTDGMGEQMEEWTLYNSWPSDVNWNELDYTNNEIQTVNVAMKFDRADKTA